MSRHLWLLLNQDAALRDHAPREIGDVRRHGDAERAGARRVGRGGDKVRGGCTFERSHDLSAALKDDLRGKRASERVNE